MVLAAFLPRAGLAHGPATVAPSAMPALWDARRGAAVASVLASARAGWRTARFERDTITMAATQNAILSQ